MWEAVAIGFIFGFMCASILFYCSGAGPDKTRKKINGAGISEIRPHNRFVTMALFIFLATAWFLLLLIGFDLI